jgi:hypothetical protein
MTYKHIFQRMLGEPAIKKHGNEEMPEGWKENLRAEGLRSGRIVRVMQFELINSFSSCRFGKLKKQLQSLSTHRKQEGNCGDKLEDEVK